MKKKFCSFALLATAGVGSMFMSACGDPALESISIKEDSIETTLLVNSEEPNWNDLVLNLTYENDDTATATKNSDMTFSRIDTSVLGTQELVVTYKGLTTKITINIVAHEEDLYDYIGYQKPDSYVLFENSKNNAGSTSDTSFAIGTYNYKVGDDNPFKFLPKITAINQNDQTVTVTEYTSDVVVKENGVELTGAALDAVVALDTANSTFDFTPEAVGRTFEITVKPVTYTDDMPFDPITFTVDVVNAWNVYDVANLSRVEANANSASLWAAKKQATGIDNTEIEGIVLHQNLEIKKSDLPEGMFHGANETIPGSSTSIGGTLIDARSFYTRDIDVNDTFSMYGNYFTISTRNTGEDAIPLVTYLTHDGQFGHAAVFSFGGDNNFNPGDPQGRVVLNSLGLKGNGSRQDADESVKGGLVGILSSAHNTTLENCLTRAFTTHIIADGEYDYPTANEIALVVKNTKMIDSYSTMVYTWGTRDNYIENCVLKQAGGPLVMATHPYAKNHPEYASNIHIKNTVLENYVGGEEAWFATTGADAVIGLLKALSQMVSGYSQGLIGVVDGLEQIASFTTTLEEGEAVNFLTCNIGDDTIFQVEPIKSLNEMKDAEGNIINKQDMQDAEVTKFVQYGLSAMPLFKAGNSYVGFNGTDLVLFTTDEEVCALTQTPFVLISLSDMKFHFDEETDDDGAVYRANKAKIDAMIADFFNADYFNFFYNGQCLGATFQMFHTPAPAAPQA